MNESLREKTPPPPPPKSEETSDGSRHSSSSYEAKRRAKNFGLRQTHLPAQVYKPRSKSLQDVVKSSPKLEATLIGYNEAPIDATAPDAIPFENLKLQEPSRSQCSPKMHSISEKPKKIFSTSIRSIGLPQPSLVAQQPQSPASIGNNLLGGDLCKKSARSHLYEICAINSWKPPFFECCKETGPSHSKEFTFMVYVDIEEASNVIVAFGAAHSRKKDAAEHAAEGALWYLKNAGYLHEQK